MAYTITKSDGTLLATTATNGIISDNAVDSSTSLDLVGRNLAGYGQYLNRNFVKLLENFSSTSAPANPIVGQLWWDKSSANQLKVWQSNGTWKIVGSSPILATAPTTPTAGDTYYDTARYQFRVYNGVAWIDIGPASLPDTPVTAIVANAVSATDGTHYVGNVTINNKLAAIFSSDSGAFTLTTPFGGITSVVPGLNLGTGLQVAGNAIIGNVGTGIITSNVITTGTINATTINATTVLSGSGNVTVGNVNAAHYGNTIGATAIYSGNVTAGNIITTTSYGNAIGATAIYSGNVTSGNLTTGKITASNATFSGNVSFTGNITLPAAATIDLSAVTQSIVPSANLTYNLGSTSTWWNNIYGTAVHAQYADLAERFKSDTEYAPGTVVELGGAAEITAAGTDLSEEVFGVISTNAAYLMNSGAGSDATHPPVAVQGRVPVRVTGTIRKGDRLVSAGDGVARAGKRSEITAWNVIGRALEDKTSPGPGIVEAVVKLNS
jgi:hypothetical protein